jgi:hypothetical protein
VAWLVSAAASRDDGSYAFSDERDDTDQPSVNLYDNLEQAGPLYAFSWLPSLN